MSDRSFQIRLVLRSQAGDRNALDQLLRSVQGRLYNYVLRLVREKPLALDVMQDVFVVIIRKLPWLRDPSFFSAWCYRIASREAVRALGRKQKFRENTASDILIESIQAPPKPRCFKDEFGESFEDMLCHISPASRVVLALHYLEDLKLPEIADILDIPLGTVKSRLARGISILRDIVRL